MTGPDVLASPAGEGPECIDEVRFEGLLVGELGGNIEESFEGGCMKARVATSGGGVPRLGEGRAGSIGIEALVIGEDSTGEISSDVS